MSSKIPALVLIAILGAGLWAFISPRAEALDVRVVKMQHCQVSCTADGGTPNELYDCLDGGTLYQTDAVRVTNPTSTPVHIGARIARGDGRAVSVNGGVAEICDGCIDGANWSGDVAIADLGCTSEGAAVNVRVTGASK